MALYLHFLSSILLLYSLVSLQLLQSSGENSDLRSLLEFKKGIKEDPSGKVLGSWNESFPLESWHGVVSEDNNVVGVSLDGLSLSGEIKFSTVVGMRFLRSITLSGNSLTGRLVPTIGSMSVLQHLDLSGNKFYGPIPGRISDIYGLVHLNLSRNGFSGALPDGMRNLLQLRILDVSGNELRGDVGKILSELRNVEHLDLSGNAFYGELAVEKANLSSLGDTAKIINLSFNRISGGFFSGSVVPLFKNLEVLDVSFNQLRGELPSFGSLYNLRVFRARNNQFFGPLPEELFGSSAALLELDLSGNGFSGD